MAQREKKIELRTEPSKRGEKETYLSENIKTWPCAGEKGSAGW